jgi:hypothetical protein
MRRPDGVVSSSKRQLMIPDISTAVCSSTYE